MSSDLPVHIGGAGLMGSLLAWRLARQGRRVRVFERASASQPASAAWTAAAMIAPWAERPACHERVFQLGLRSLSSWPTLLETLEEDSGLRVPMGQTGSLVVAHPADRSELQQFRQDLERRQAFNPSAVKPLNEDQLRTLEPALNPQLLPGYWLPQESHLDSRQLLPALHAAAQRHGAELYFEKPLPPASRTHLTIDCCGTGSDFAGVRGVRGEVIRIRSPEVVIQRPVRLLHPRYHLYLVPKGQFDGQNLYLLGATEIDSEDRSPVSVRSALELLSALYSLCPGLSEARIDALETNLRPALPHHCPDIHHESPYLLRINGLFRHGFLLAPALLHQLQDDHGLSLGLQPTPIKEVYHAFVG